jgi:hypothetical protein
MISHLGLSSTISGRLRRRHHHLCRVVPPGSSVKNQAEEIEQMVLHLFGS